MPVTASVRHRQHHEIKLPDIRGPSKVKVGFPASESSQSNIEKAIWNEFGTRRGIPERPFMRNAMRNNTSKYRMALKASASKLVLGQTDLRTVLNKLGALAQGHIQEEITALRSPPNAQTTVDQKGSSNPLIDTGAMRQAVTWVIEE